MDEFDELLEQSNTERLTEDFFSDGLVPPFQYDEFASSFNHMLLKDSPRLSMNAQRHHLQLLRERTRQKRGSQRFPLAALFGQFSRWLEVAAIALVVVLVVNGIGVVSASSLPGSPLYPVKRSAEQSEILLAPTAGERARIWMNLTTVRLEEAEHLLATKQQVDNSLFDAIDQSMLRSLAEISETQGDERRSLLDAVAQLAQHERDELTVFAQHSEYADLVRLARTVQLLDDILIITNHQPKLLAPSVSSPTPLPAVSPTAAPTQGAVQNQVPRLADSVPVMELHRSALKQLPEIKSNAPATPTPEDQERAQEQSSKKESDSENKGTQHSSEKQSPPEEQARQHSAAKDTTEKEQDTPKTHSRQTKKDD